MFATRSTGARRWHHGLAALVAAVLLFVAPPVARAFVFTNPSDDVSIEIAPAPGEKLCVMAPRGHLDPSMCGALDQAAADEQLKKMGGGEEQLMGMGFLQSGERMLIVTIVASGPATRDIASGAEKRAKDLAAGLGDGAGFALQVQQWKIVDVAGRDALMVTAGVDPKTPLPVSFAHVHRIPTRDVDVLFALMTDEGNEAWAADVAARAMKSMRAPMPPSTGEQIVDALTSKPGDASPESDLERTRARWRMYGYATRIGLIALVIVGVVLYANRRNVRMRRRTAERMAQGINPNDESRRD